MNKKAKAKRFFCKYEECGKGFERRDHLERHELNHRKDRIKCGRCDAQFSRNDLLSKYI